LWLVIEVEDDSRFRREGDDLYTTVPVPLYAAVLGGTVTVSLVAGKASLKVPAGTQNGTEMRLKGQGMPRLGRSGQRGDLYVTVDVRLPEKLTEREKALFRDLEKLRE
jgi:curved DNA-binding protein